MKNIRTVGDQFLPLTPKHGFPSQGAPLLSCKDFFSHTSFNCLKKRHKIKRHPDAECPSKMHCVTLPTAALSASGKMVEV